MAKLNFDARDNEFYERMTSIDKMGDWMLKVDKLYKRTKLYRRKSFKAKSIPQEYFDMGANNE